jgi:hypothetical protein
MMAATVIKYSVTSSGAVDVTGEPIGALDQQGSMAWATPASCSMVVLTETPVGWSKCSASATPAGPTRTRVVEYDNCFGD